MSRSHPTRREFTATMAAAALTACARRSATPLDPAVTPATTGTSPATPPKPDANAPLADALLTVVTTRYGASVDASHRKDVRGGILHTLQLSDRLRKVTLPNSVDPFSSLCTTSAAGRADEAR